MFFCSTSILTAPKLLQTFFPFVLFKVLFIKVCHVKERLCKKLISTQFFILPFLYLGKAPTAATVAQNEGPRAAAGPAGRRPRRMRVQRREEEDDDENFGKVKTRV